jgi:lipopolysaccharide transport protein LptA
MKTTFALWVVLIVPACGLLRAEVPPDLRTKVILERNTTNGPVLDILLSGDTTTNCGERDDLIRPFQMKSFHNGQVNDVQLIGQALQCHIDRIGGRAWDAGPLVLFTPTTNLWVQGEGFYFIQSNHFLYLSNKVETRVLRSLLKTTMAGTVASNAPGAAERLLKIFSSQGQFDYESNVAVYLGAVHVIDVQLDMTSDRLTVHFTTNGAVQTILAEGSVVMTTTNKGQATAARAFYYVTNANEMMELTGQAAWTNGDERAVAEKFIYDSTHHFLTGEGHVRVWWPNPAPGAAERRTEAPPRAGPGGFRELFADWATLQMPPTNGPLEAMHASGNVIIVNQADQSRATGEQADYRRTNDWLALTGDPVWWNDEMEIKGRVLTAELTNKIYRARGNSNFKRKVNTNQWLKVACVDLDFQTNHAVFHDDVKARLFEEETLRDTLNSDLLEVELFSNQVKSAVARGHVQGETAPDKLGRIKTVACDTLTLHRSPASGLTKDVVAEDHAVLQEFGTNPAAPHDKLTAAKVTAFFSAVTNQIERVVAVQNVVFDQIKTNQNVHATGQEAVYTAANDETRITGEPVARTERYMITGANCLIWQSKSNHFSAFGPYSMSNPNPAHPPPKP